MEDKNFVEKTEKEIEQEQQLKQTVQEQLKKESESQGLVINNIPQKFHKDGMMERTSEKSSIIIDKIINVINEFDIGDVTTTRMLRSECQGEKNTVPNLFFVGEDVQVKFRVMPTDKYGNDGRSWLKQEKYDKIKKECEKKNGKN